MTPITQEMRTFLSRLLAGPLLVLAACLVIRWADPQGMLLPSVGTLIIPVVVIAVFISSNSGGFISGMLAAAFEWWFVTAPSPGLPAPALLNIVVVLALTVSMLVFRGSLYLTAIKMLLDLDLDAVYTVDPHSLAFQYASRGACEQLGYTVQEFRRMTYPEVTVAPVDQHTVSEVLARLGDGPGSPHRYETDLRKKNGEVIHAEVLLQQLHVGRVHRIVAMVRDITERKSAEADLKTSEQRYQHLAFHDPLTELPNRAAFQSLLAERLAEGSSQTVGVLFLGIDRFKPINESLGHSIGDAVIVAAGQRLRRVSQAHDAVARMSGDEFAVLFTQLEEPQEGMHRAEAVIHAFRKPLRLGEREIYISVSAGLALSPGDSLDPSALLNYADTALFQAKRAGGNRVERYHALMSAEASIHLALETDLHHALPRQEFFLCYQPQVDSATGRMVGMEALLRWQHPTHGVVEPGRFISLAEENGTIESIGEWVLSTACAQNVRWQQEGFEPLRIAVNLSARQFYNPDLSQRISEILSETRLDARWLELEITESTLMQRPEQTIRTLAELRSLGIRISLDDFGTGFSSMNYLKHFPIDTLKIDRSFVRGVGVNPMDTAICNTLIVLSKELNLTSIAEGVETQRQRDYFAERGCTLMQGYWFSRPIPASEFEALLTTSRVS